MKTVLCYGDSLTYGSNPATGERHAFEDRWPTVLGAGLGDDKVRIIAEGLGGRTTVFDEWGSPADMNGARILPTIIKSHTPLDCVVIMLGTNDLKPFISGNALSSAMGMKRLAEIVRTYPYNNGTSVPEVVMVSPPKCCPTEHADLKPMFERSVEESARLTGFYERIAKENNCAFFDAATVAVASPLDGVHLDAENTIAIGEGLVPVVKKVLGL